jgi:hypothetical protein
MSRRRQDTRFSVYSLPPSRNTLRAISTSVWGMGIDESSLEKESETSA